MLSLNPDPCFRLVLGKYHVSGQARQLELFRAFIAEVDCGSGRRKNFRDEDGSGGRAVIAIAACAIHDYIRKPYRLRANIQTKRKERDPLPAVEPRGKQYEQEVAISAWSRQGGSPAIMRPSTSSERPLLSLDPGENRGLVSIWTGCSILMSASQRVIITVAQSQKRVHPRRVWSRNPSYLRALCAKRSRSRKASLLERPR